MSAKYSNLSRAKDASILTPCLDGAVHTYATKVFVVTCQ